VSGLGQLVLTAAFDDDAREWIALRVERADELIEVDAGMYHLARVGDLRFTTADEDGFVIETTTGTLRYRLTGERRGTALVARREVGA
jgi:hypothetical protein